MVDYDKIIQEQAARLEDAGFSSKAARGNALELLKLVKKRDEGKVCVPHPKGTKERCGCRTLPPRRYGSL